MGIGSILKLHDTHVKAVTARSHPRAAVKSRSFLSTLAGKVADSHTAGPLWIRLTVSAGDGERQTG